MQGCVQVYTGDGKGKTTAALGLSLRAAGAGLKVYIAHFMKKGDYSEMAACRKLGRQVTAEQFGTGRFVRGNPDAEDLAAGEAGLMAVRSAMTSGDYDLVVADEACVAVAMGVLNEQAVLDLLAARPAGVELVLTGRGASEAILAAADLVTEMRAVKHYYEKGVPARKGIEH